jgi:hypothetical protein
VGLLPVAAAASIALAVFAANAVEAYAPVGPFACDAVGSGNAQYAYTFQKAYDAAGGQRLLGCPTTNVVGYAGGYQQNLRGPRGRSVITSIDPGTAFVLGPDEYQGFLDIAGEGRSFDVAGYPVSNKMRLKDGWIIYLATGDQRQRSALIRRDGGSWYWVAPGFWEFYYDHGGPDGKLGYPTGNQQATDNGELQAFEHDSLFYRADIGVLTKEQYEHQPPASAAPQVPQASSQQPTGQPAQTFCAYTVSGGASDGAMPIVLEPGGSIQEEFKPPPRPVTGLYVVIGLDPRLAHLDRDHDMTLVLWSADEKSHFAFNGDTNQADNNGQTSFGPGLPVTLSSDMPYYLQLINKSAEPVGVYAKPESSSDRGTSKTSGIIVRGERLSQAEHFRPGWALSACIETH